MTPLGIRLAARIRTHGPLGVDRFMAACLADPTHGYYHTRDPLGAAGDFTTAPEISQVFGEIIGAWLAERWQAMGTPDPVLLVELGPGRGTLMADILRTLDRLPACRAAIRVHLVETSPVLRARQQAVLAGRDPTPRWHDSLETVPDGALLLVANEFFDALPVRQFCRHGGAWHERLVGLDEGGRFAFTLGAAADPAVPVDAGVPPEGALFETCPAAVALGRTIARRLRRTPGAALIVDYGHARSGFGETLQAVRAHRPTGVFDEPGEADLTAHVDFQALAAALDGADLWGPVAQGRFLTANGAGLREARLTAGREGAAATAIRRAIRRLIDPAAMGRLFKVLAATTPGQPRPAGF